MKLLNLIVHCGLKQGVELGGFLGSNGHVGDFRGDADRTGVTAEVGKAQLLHVGHLENDSHVVIPFWIWAQKSRPKWTATRA
jgi:hypothetical protein